VGKRLNLWDVVNSENTLPDHITLTQQWTYISSTFPEDKRLLFWKVYFFYVQRFFDQWPWQRGSVSSLRALTQALNNIASDIVMQSVQSDGSAPM